jgi:hypothetical protein
VYPAFLKVRELGRIEHMKDEGDEPVDDDRRGEGEVFVGKEGEDGWAGEVVERRVQGSRGDAAE